MSVTVRQDQSVLTSVNPMPKMLQTKSVSRSTRIADGRLTDGTQVPQAVVDSGQNSAVLRVADLSEQRGRSQLRKTVAKPKTDTTADVHCQQLVDGDGDA